MGVTRGGQEEGFCPTWSRLFKEKYNISGVFKANLCPTPTGPPRANFTSLVKKSADAHGLEGSLPLSSIENSFRVLQKTLREGIWNSNLLFIKLKFPVWNQSCLLWGLDVVSFYHNSRFWSFQNFTIRWILKQQMNGSN